MLHAITKRPVTAVGIGSNGVAAITALDVAVTSLLRHHELPMILTLSPLIRHVSLLLLLLLL